MASKSKRPRKRIRNYVREYQIRIAQGLASGKSRSEARGHARATDLGESARRQPFSRSNPKGLKEASLFQLERWRHAHLLPPARQLPNAYQGSDVEYPPGTARQTARLMELLISTALNRRAICGASTLAGICRCNFSNAVSSSSPPPLRQRARRGMSFLIPGRRGFLKLRLPIFLSDLKAFPP
jgi:hypothetical protein